MQTLETTLPASLEVLQEELMLAMPDYAVRIEKNLFGKNLLVQKGKFSGASIHLTKSKLQVTYVVPSTLGRSIIGLFGLLGLGLIRLFTKDALEPRTRVLEYLSARYSPVKKRI